MCACVLCQLVKKFLEGEFVQACKPLQVCVRFCEFVHVCLCICKCMCTVAPCEPQGQKSRKMRVYNNNTAGSPEQCVNMDTMEMHYAIMAGFMHFSLAGRMEREGEIKERISERENRKGATARGENNGEGRRRNDKGRGEEKN